MRRRILDVLLLGALTSCGGEGESPGIERGAAPPQEARPDDPNPPTARREQAETLLADLLAVRHPSDGGGRAWLEPPAADDPPVRAGERRRFVVHLEVGPEGIAEGGSIHFMPEPYWGWSVPQDLAEDRVGFTRVTTEAAGVELETSVVGGFQAGYLVARVAGRGLAPGEVVRIEYGAGPSLAQVDRHAERDAHLWLYVDGDGDGVRGLLVDSPTLDILPNAPARLVLHAPSIVRPGETAELRVALLDALANPVGPPDGAAAREVLLRNRPPGWDLPERLELASDGTARLAFEARAPGILRLAAELELEDVTLHAEAPPTWVHPETPRIRWGDLHGHSNYSDGTGVPEDWYRYARDVAALDVAALTDHDHFGVRFLDAHEELWADIRAQTERFHDPGRFVTVLGYEWTSWVHGHRHVLLFDGEGEVLSSLDEATDTPRELWSALAGRPALTFAHHSAGEPVPTNWTFAPDPVLEPLTEIVSVHGSSEARDGPRPVRGGLPGNFVRDVLDRGYRLGFVGSGDGHDGHPGLAHLSPVYGWSPPRPGESDARVGTGGLAAILTEELTREGVLGTLRARRTYATSGPRIVIWARLNGRAVGEELAPADLASGAEIDLTVIGTAPLRHVDVVRPGAIERLTLAGERVFQGRLPAGAPKAGEYLYLRVEQVDGGAAWTSPFFVR